MTDLSKLQAGDKVMYRNVGYGVTTYEGPEAVIKQEDGKLFTPCFDRMGMDWLDSKKTWVFDGGMGLRCYVCALDDEVMLAQLRADAANGDDYSIDMLEEIGADA